MKCQANGCGKDATYEVRKFKLCEEHAKQQIHCIGCKDLIQVADLVVVRYITYPDTNQRLCVACDGLPQEGCICCGKIVTVDGRTTAAHTNYGETNQRLCAACDGLPKETCSGCGKIVKVNEQQLVDGSSHNDGAILLCGDCAGSVSQRCRACTAPSAVRTPDGRDQLLAGASRIHPVDDEATTVGWRCPVCATDSLGNTVDAQAAYSEAVAWMRGWVESCGEDYPGYGGRLTWSLNRDGEFTMDDSGQELGHCATTTHGDEPKTYNIQILCFMRPLSFQQTLIHELTHALTNEFRIGDKPKIEGFCNYVAYLYLKHVQDSDPARRAEASRAIKRMMENTNKEYGEDFRDILDFLGTSAEALTWLSGT